MPLSTKKTTQRKLKPKPQKPPVNKPNHPIKRKMKRQGIFFGILTSIMTIIPFQIGVVASGDVTPREVMSAIVSMAVADSMADAYGIFFSDEASDSDIKQSDAVLASIITFATKIICQLSFAIPFLITQGVVYPTTINCVWSMKVLLIANDKVAKIRGVSETAYLIKTSLFTGGIIASSYWLTKFVSSWKK